MSSTRFSCIRASANTGPACIRARKLFPNYLFPVCIGFVPGGNGLEQNGTSHHKFQPSQRERERYIYIERDKEIEI